MNENLFLAVSSAAMSAINLAVGIRNDTWWGYICLGLGGGAVVAALTFFHDFVVEGED